jgi:hypothetical protein
MPSPKQLSTLERYVGAIHEILIDQISGVRSGAPRQIVSNRSVFIRMLGQLLYEAPNLHTGKCSVRLVEQKLKNFNTKPCHEHHHGRQKGGLALVQLVDAAVVSGIDPTKDQVRDIALQYCQVHYTTAKENALLRKQQRKCSSEAAYRRSNIVLIDAPDLFTHQGRHPEQWKQAMRDKYQPIIDAIHNPPMPNAPIIELPLVIH